MKLETYFFFCLFICLAGLINAFKNAPEDNTILIGISFKNREVFLPYFLSFFHRLSFPKNQISLKISLGKSTDRTLDIVKAWLKHYGKDYRNVDVQEKEDWDTQQNIEDILTRARDIRVDYVLFIDPVVFLTEEYTIQHLMTKDKAIVAGMLHSTDLYSNFWGDMTEDFDYKRSHFYIEIYRRKNQGCFKAALAHSCVLIDLTKKESRELSFHGPNGYSVSFALSARINNVSIYICNDKIFGYIVPHTSNLANYDMEEEIQRMAKIKKIIHKNLNPLEPLELFISSGFIEYPEVDNLGMDQIYIINLLSRPIKKRVMEERLKEFGLDAHFFEAVNGSNLNSSYLLSIGANQLKSYDDIYMTEGAVGSFLSHFFIWRDVIKNKYERVMVFEDDTEFDLDFKKIVQGALQELDIGNLEWEFLFLNRGTAIGPSGDKIKHSNYLQNVGYGMLSISGYVLNLKGAKKLATYTALSEMIPVDDYVLLMHSPDFRELRDWENSYGPSDLKVYLIDPEPSFNVPYQNGTVRLTDTLYSPRTNDHTFGLPIGQKPTCHRDEL